MYFLKGNKTQKYSFLGPFINISFTKNLPGIYIIICNSKVIEIGISKNIRDTLDEYYDLKKRINKCAGVLQFAVIYKKSKQTLKYIENDISKYYNLPKNKLNNKSANIFKKFGPPALIFLFCSFIFISLVTMNCSDSPTSFRYTEMEKEGRNIGKIIDSMKHILKNDSIKKKPLEKFILKKTDTTYQAMKVFKDTNLTFSKIDSTEQNMKVDIKSYSGKRMSSMEYYNNNINNFIKILLRPALVIYIGVTVKLIFGWSRKLGFYPVCLII
ncbi:MAG: hypothetical protein EHM58_19830 [Ignavibacteriae bacterium]|nr:MAG: hypothetical protein EHM58_19830 [Ignavibacteriota bacterium]